MRPRLQRLRARTNGYTVTPHQYLIAAYVALGALTLIVLTGAAVRLTGSGLGCPSWPSCYGKAYPPLQTNAIIEFGNRLLTGPVSLAAGMAWLLALRRRPYRRELTRLAALLPLGVIGQAILGGLTVRGQLDYGWVMGHFALSMLLLAAAMALAWRARFEPGERPLAPDARLVWWVRGLLALGALAIFAGTAATAAGPHAGGNPGQRINRLDFDGRATMDFVIHRHGEIALAFGLLAVFVWWLARRHAADALLQRALTALCVLIALQGAVGLDQYETHLPTELVWIHVALACACWLACLWATCAAGRPQRAGEPLCDPAEGPAARAQEPVVLASR
jgi:cytochrome c oxidase assembly protein subunit 15